MASALFGDFYNQGNTKALEDLMLELSQKGKDLLDGGCLILTLLMILVGFYSSFSNSFEDYSIHVKMTIPLIMMVLA